jgi:hypothetical protein
LAWFQSPTWAGQFVGKELAGGESQLGFLLHGAEFFRRVWRGGLARHNLAIQRVFGSDFSGW